MWQYTVIRLLVDALELPVTAWAGNFYVTFNREVDREAFTQLLNEELCRLKPQSLWTK